MYKFNIYSIILNAKAPEQSKTTLCSGAFCVFVLSWQKNIQGSGYWNYYYNGGNSKKTDSVFITGDTLLKLKTTPYFEKFEVCNIDSYMY